jgi:hypothetical protein
LISDRISGLFLFDFDKDLFSKLQPQEEFIIFPNPSSTNESCTFSIPYEAKDPQLKIIDLFGKVIWEVNFINKSIVTLDRSFSSGMYCVQFEYSNYLNERQTQMKKLIIE